MKKSLFLLCCLVAVACGTSKVADSANTLSQSDADRAAAKFPGTTMEDLSRGKTLYENNCGKCHKLHAPQSRGEEAWRKVVPPMAKKAKMDESGADLVLRYLVTMCGN